MQPLNTRTIRIDKSRVHPRKPDIGYRAAHIDRTCRYLLHLRGAEPLLRSPLAKMIVNQAIRSVPVIRPRATAPTRPEWSLRAEGATEVLRDYQVLGREISD
jgi:hypothetical protein